MAKELPQPPHYPIEEEKDNRPPPRRAKYADRAHEPPIATDLLSDRDAKSLATLVRKYGRAVVEDSVKNVGSPRGRGRPPRGQLPYFERIHLAQWFDER